MIKRMNLQPCCGFLHDKRLFRSTNCDKAKIMPAAWDTLIAFNKHLINPIILATENRRRELKQFTTPDQVAIYTSNTKTGK